MKTLVPQSNIRKVYTYFAAAISTGVLIFLCCMLPIGFILLGALGISWFTPYFNYVLGGVMVVFIMLGLRAYTKHCDINRCYGIKEKLFTCPECKLTYKEKEWRDQCEKFCKEYHACNIEITSHAIKKES